MCIFDVSFTYVIEGIDSKVISVCLINDYSLIADLHIFVFARAECESISLKCTKVELSILINFGLAYMLKHVLFLVYVILNKFLLKLWISNFDIFDI